MFDHVPQPQTARMISQQRIYTAWSSQGSSCTILLSMLHKIFDAYFTLNEELRGCHVPTLSLVRTFVFTTQIPSLYLRRRQRQRQQNAE